MTLPAALLLSQCAPTDGTLLPQTVNADSFSTRLTLPMSFHSSLLDPPGTFISETGSASSEYAWFQLAAEDPAIDTSPELDVILLAPLVVTDNLNSVLLAGLRYWPGDPVDAEEKQAWISFKQAEDHSTRYPMGDSGQAWTMSHR